MNRIMKKRSSRLFAVTKGLLLVFGCFVGGNLCAMRPLPIHDISSTQAEFVNLTVWTINVKVHFPIKTDNPPFIYKIKPEERKNIILKKKKVESGYIVASWVEIIARKGRKEYKKEFPRFFFKANKKYSIIKKDSIVIEPGKKKYDSVESSQVKLLSVIKLPKQRSQSEYGSFEALPTKKEFEKKRLEGFVNIKEGENDLTNNNTSSRRFFNKSGKGFTIEGSNLKTNMANIERSDRYFDVKFNNEYFDKDKEYKIIFRLSKDRSISKMYKISDLKRSNVIYEISIVPFDVI